MESELNLVEQILLADRLLAEFTVEPLVDLLEPISNGRKLILTTIFEHKLTVPEVSVFFYY